MFSKFLRSNSTFKPSCRQLSDQMFKLEDNFLRSYDNKSAPFGFNGLGELVYLRTYSRKIDASTRENWQQTVERVVNGTFQMQIDWLCSSRLPCDKVKMQGEAQDMYHRIFNMKFLPPGRGLWAMGTPITKERKLFAALNNCAFVSTKDLSLNSTRPFCFLMDASMLGVGVGFDTLGANTITIRIPTSSSNNTFIVPDSREGWVESLHLLLDSYFHPITTDNNSTPHKQRVNFDYSAIRPAGLPIKGFGGVSQGPLILQDLHTSIIKALDANDGKNISITTIVDIMNLIGKCVVSGNVRRTAEIAFGDPHSEEYISLKDYSINPHRAEYGWTSNNSVLAPLGMDYSNVCQKIKYNGEPGFAWLENMRKFGRMSDAANHKDYRAGGGNPCLEQTLESYELCCLVELFPDHHTDLEDFLQSVKAATLYAKSVTLGPTHWEMSNEVMLRNRRFGASLSGLAQFIARKGMGQLREWCEAGYSAIQLQDKALSERFAIPVSIKTTCIKPSGTVSLLAGATPGMHYPQSRHYIRRVRLAATSELLPILTQSGYHVEPSVTDPANTAVLSIPIDAGEAIRTVKDVSMWEQLALASFLQAYWADNQVSCTVTFDPEKEGSQLQHALDLYQYQLKGVSFLPTLPEGAYPQMPYETITKEAFHDMMAKITPVSFSAAASTSNSTSTGTPTSTPSSGSVYSVFSDNSISNGSESSGNTNSDENATVHLYEEEVPDKFCDTAGCSLDMAPDRVTRNIPPLR